MYKDYDETCRFANVSNLLTVRSGDLQTSGVLTVALLAIPEEERLWP